MWAPRGDATTFAWVAALADSNHTRVRRDWWLCCTQGRLERAVVLRFAAGKGVSDVIGATRGKVRVMVTVGIITSSIDYTSLIAPGVQYHVGVIGIVDGAG